MVVLFPECAVYVIVPVTTLNGPVVFGITNQALFNLWFCGGIKCCTHVPLFLPMLVPRITPPASCQTIGTMDNC